MQLILSGKGMSLTESMKEHVSRKIGSLDHFWKDIIRIHVEVSKNQHHTHGDIFVVYAWVETPGNDIRVSNEGAHFQQVVDGLSVKLERVVTKSKEKLADR